MSEAILITWKPAIENPDRGWPTEEMQGLYERLQRDGYADQRWRFLRQKGVEAGNPVYLVRQGRQGPALIGVGEVIQPSQSNEKSALVRFSRLCDPRTNEVLATGSELQAITTQNGVWNTVGSGIAIAADVAERLKLLAERSVLVEQKSRNPDWTRDELILALDLYFRVPAARGSKTHPECAALSDLLNRLPIHRDKDVGATFRNPNGVGMKLSNFLKYDPEYKGKGLAAGSRAEEEVWRTFAGDQIKLRETSKLIALAATELEAAGLVADEEDDEAEEGRVLTRLHKYRERDANLVRGKKAKVLALTGALRCEVCEFDFRAEFGAHGEGFAECHHARPISTLGSGDKTKTSDLHIVCANCHRMLHRGKPWPSVAQLREVKRRSTGHADR